MFTFFEKPIYQQIREYIHWRSANFPYVAQEHGDKLREFARATGVRTVHEIEQEDIESFIEQFSGTYLRMVYVHVLRQFFRFSKRRGWVAIDVAPVDRNGRIPDMTKTHHLLDLENVIRVKTLRSRVSENGKPMSYRAIRDYLSRKDKRKYDVHAIYRWANYRLPKGIELSTGGL